MYPVYHSETLFVALVAFPVSKFQTIAVLHCADFHGKSPKLTGNTHNRD